jgi:ATP-dependent RNA helicase DHX37/DHR1
MEGHRKAKAVRYQACMVDEIVFLNRRSSLYHAAPEFLVYSELLHTKWPYIHGPKSVKPEWLANYGESSCGFSEVEHHKPFYHPETDQAFHAIVPFFTLHLWELLQCYLPFKR